MESRREFLKKAALLSSASAWWSIPESIRRALAIDPAIGSTYLDAEHIVILMQENRSFDHSFGTLQGVRGFNDPRAHRLADLKPVWLQTNKDGETYAPFRLNIRDTNVTWMGSLPHSWADQVDARNDGRYDRWLFVKPCYYKGYEKMPMTLGHYTRQDIPFYYAFADAFTICDQHFCSCLTGTTPNRLYLWSGTIRAEQSADSKPHVYNEEADFGTEVGWTTFPERLEAEGVSWKVYQNELTVETGFKGEEEGWLSNFGDNPLEYFLQFNVRLCARHRAYLADQTKKLEAQVVEIENAHGGPPTTDEKLTKLKAELAEAQANLARWSKERFEALSQTERGIHAKAFSTSESDPHFRELETLSYWDGETERTVQVPKGDVLYQFRQDVESGQLPTVSWIVGPENFSDHPASAWYGAWYVSEALDILTKNPELWKKTIFILTYDENDGYFDHVPPLVAPNPGKPESGKVSEGIDASVEYVTKEQDRAFRPSYSPRESALGLGYRVPLVVASPWSRGGHVCSQVFDHTSVIQFLEHFLSERGTKIREPNLSAWRRTVCGNLTSVFQQYSGGPAQVPAFPPRDDFIEEIHRAKFKDSPLPPRPLASAEIEAIKSNPAASPLLPRQELGTRQSCPLPYELYADGNMNGDRTQFEIQFRAGADVFGNRSQGAPFNAYAYVGFNELWARAYAVSAGKVLADVWPLADSEDGGYHIRVDGPNGFMREFEGAISDPDLVIRVSYERRPSKTITGNVAISVVNRDSQPHVIQGSDLSYGASPFTREIRAGGHAQIILDLSATRGWYDFSLRLQGSSRFKRRVAGRVETGKWSITDPAMGGLNG